MKLSRRPLVLYEIKDSIFSCLEPGSCVEILQPLISDGRLGMARYLAPSGWSMWPELGGDYNQMGKVPAPPPASAVPFPEGPDSFPNSISLYRNAPKCRPGRSLFRSTDSRSPTEREREIVIRDHNAANVVHADYPRRTWNFPPTGTELQRRRHFHICRRRLWHRTLLSSSSAASHFTSPSASSSSTSPLLQTHLPPSSLRPIH